MRRHKRKSHEKTKVIKLDADDIVFENSIQDVREKRTCPSGKRVYHKPSSAAGVAQNMRKRFKDPCLESYKCPYCDFWHVGHHAGTEKVMNGLMRYGENFNNYSDVQQD